MWKDYTLGRRTLIVGSRIRNDFFSPASINTDGAMTGEGEYINTYTPDGEFEFHMQIGSKLYPEYPFKSHVEAY